MGGEHATAAMARVSAPTDVRPERLMVGGLAMGPRYLSRQGRRSYGGLERECTELGTGKAGLECLYTGEETMRLVHPGGRDPSPPGIEWRTPLTWMPPLPPERGALLVATCSATVRRPAHDDTCRAERGGAATPSGARARASGIARLPMLSPFLSWRVPETSGREGVRPLAPPCARDPLTILRQAGGSQYHRHARLHQLEAQGCVAPAGTAVCGHCRRNHRHWTGLRSGWVVAAIVAYFPLR